MFSKFGVNKTNEKNYTVFTAFLSIRISITQKKLNFPKNHIFSDRKLTFKHSTYHSSKFNT